MTHCRDLAVEALDLPAQRKVHDGAVEIVVLHVADCPHVNLLRDRLRAALDATGAAASVVERLVTEGGTAAGFGGSPAVLLDGRDPFTSSGDCGPACRLYPTPEGLQGAPTVEQLVEALRS